MESVVTMPLDRYNNLRDSERIANEKVIEYRANYENLTVETDEKIHKLEKEVVQLSKNLIRIKNNPRYNKELDRWDIEALEELGIPSGLAKSLFAELVEEYEAEQAELLKDEEQK